LHAAPSFSRRMAAARKRASQKWIALNDAAGSSATSTKAAAIVATTASFATRRASARVPAGRMTDEPAGDSAARTHVGRFMERRFLKDGKPFQKGTPPRQKRR